MSWQEILGVEVTPQKYQKSNIEVFEEGNHSSKFDKPDYASIVGEDWEWIRKDTPTVKALNDLLEDRQLMQQGKVPSSYCYQATCDHCGEIPLYTTGHFLGCPWCLLGGYKKIRSRA